MAAQDTDQSRSHWHYTEMDDSNFHLQHGSLIVVLLVFLAIFFLTIISLYLRWVCTRDLATTADSQRPSRGLDEGTIDNLPVMCLEVLRKTEGEESYECSICITELVDGEKVRVLPACSHAFHPECVDKWLRARSNCPLCRAALGGGAAAQQPVAAAADP